MSNCGPTNPGRAAPCRSARAPTTSGLRGCGSTSRHCRRRIRPRSSPSQAAGGPRCATTSTGISSCWSRRSRPAGTDRHRAQRHDASAIGTVAAVGSVPSNHRRWAAVVGDGTLLRFRIGPTAPELQFVGEGAGRGTPAPQATRHFGRDVSVDGPVGRAGADRLLLGARGGGQEKGRRQDADRHHQPAHHLVSPAARAC